MTQYMNKMTGSIDTKDGWISSYDSGELDERKLTAEQAFSEDVGVTLFELASKESTASAFGRKGGSSKSEAKRKASAENGKKGGRPKKAISNTNIS